MAVGQETVVADALKAGRKGVLQEAADELLGREGHHLLLLPVAIIFPLEGDLTTFQRQQTAIGDGHAMRVAAQIIQNSFGTTERRFGVDHPFHFAERR